MTKEQECMKALQCLYLEVPSVIADDIKQKVIDALNEVKNLNNAEVQALNMPVVMHRVTYQGAISVNNCITYQKSDNVIAFCIDTKNKWGEISATGSNENNTPCIVLEANENTTNIRKKKTTDDLTEIEFPEYAGWTIFCCSWSKYSVYVCMVKHGA